MFFLEGESVTLTKVEVEAAATSTSSYFTTGNFLHCIYSGLVAKSHQKFWSRFLIHEFSFTYIFKQY